MMNHATIRGITIARTRAIFHLSFPFVENYVGNAANNFAHAREFQNFHVLIHCFKIFTFSQGSFPSAIFCWYFFLENGNGNNNVCIDENGSTSDS